MRCSSLRSKFILQLAQRPASRPPESVEASTEVGHTIDNDHESCLLRDPDLSSKECLVHHYTSLQRPSTSDKESNDNQDNILNCPIMHDEDLITPEDLGFERKESEMKNTNEDKTIIEDSQDLFSSGSSSVIDDSCAEDPDYIESDSDKSRKRKRFRCSEHVISDSNSSTEEVISTDVSKPKRRKIHIKRPILTEKEKVKRNKQKYPILSVSCKCCDTNSKNKCHTIDDTKRRAIWESFWNCNYTTRRRWLSKCVSTKPVERISMHAQKNRSSSRIYFLEDPESKEMLKVCKSFFLKTLGYSSDSVITSLMKAIQKKPCCAAVAENRGQYTRKPLEKDTIINHINLYHPCQSHYRRHNAPYVKYLPHGITLKSMYENYVEKNPVSHHSIEIYRQVMKEINVSLRKPKSDMCGDCEVLKQKRSEKQVMTLKELSFHAVHTLKAKYATELYRQDAAKMHESDTKVIAVDLQKVFLIPIMPDLKDSVFLSRLIAFNLTFAPLKKGEKAVCVLWHEEISERDAQNIIDAFYKFIKRERDTKHFIFWADNCSAQNKNWFLYTAFVQIVNVVESGVETITIKYLTKGHTHNAADSVHGNIERALTKKRNVYDFDDMKDVVLHSRKNLMLLEIDPAEDKFNWTKKKRQLTKKSDDPLKAFYLSDIISVQFRKGSKAMYYQTLQNTEMKEICFLQKRFDMFRLPERKAGRRGIKPSKKEAIVEKLVPFMPENRRYFWQNLQTTENASDLILQEVTIEEYC